jgi:HlyD family secretion protein
MQGALPKELAVSRKVLIVIAALLVVGGAGAFYWKAHESVGPSPYVTVPVKRGRIEAKVTATGTLSPLVNVTIGSQISGQIAKLMADYNSVVKKGQIVAMLDTRLYEAAVAQQRANVLSAQGDLAKAKATAIDARRQAKRSHELLAQKLVAQADTDTADATADADEAAITSMEGELAQAKANLLQAETNLRFCTIISPVDGVVISRSVEIGQTVAASMTAPILFVIAGDLKKMQIDTNVSESDVGKIVAGMEVTFHVDAYPTEVFHGTVRQVRNAATTVSNVVTYDAVVDVSNPELKLKPGMTATLSFVYAESKEALKLPTSALRFIMPSETGKDRSGAKAPSGEHHRKHEADVRTVWILAGTPPTAQQAQIHVGISDGTVIEVSDGVKEGDLVITDIIDVNGKPGSKRGGGPRF